MFEIKDLINEGLSLHASGRTRKYVLQDRDYEVKLEKLARTVETMRANVRKNKAIVVDGEDYKISDYKLFGNLPIIVRCGAVWATTSAREACEPYFQAASPAVDDAFACMTPDELDAFIDDYNNNQKDPYILGKDDISRDVVTVNTFKGWAGHEDNSVVLNDAGLGSIDEKAAVINGVVSPFEAKVSRTLKGYSQEVLAKWLIWKN